MRIKDRVFSALQATDGLCDDCLSEIADVHPRQIVNIQCRQLSSQNELVRARETCGVCGRLKIVNHALMGNLPQARITPDTTPATRSEDSRPWFWEGNVQTKIVEYLKANGWTVHSQADTASRQQGKDIVASDSNGQMLWITVKGFPERSKNTQARHWFAGAHHDLARYRNESKQAMLAMGLPHGFKTYEGLIKRDDAVRRFLGYRVYWVQADGTVTVDLVS